LSPLYINSLSNKWYASKVSVCLDSAETHKSVYDSTEFCNREKKWKCKWSWTLACPGNTIISKVFNFSSIL